MSFSCRIRQCFCSSTIRFEHVFFINKQFNKFAHVQMLSRMSSLSGRIILELSPFVFSLLVYSKSSTCYLLFVCNTSDQGITVRVIDGYRHHEPFLGYINDCRPIGGGGRKVRTDIMNWLVIPRPWVGVWVAWPMTQTHISGVRLVVWSDWP